MAEKVNDCGFEFHAIKGKESFCGANIRVFKSKQRMTSGHLNIWQPLKKEGNGESTRVGKCAVIYHEENLFSMLFISLVFLMSTSNC